jgi:hypothetical protein
VAIVTVWKERPDMWETDEVTVIVKDKQPIPDSFSQKLLYEGRFCRVALRDLSWGGNDTGDVAEAHLRALGLCGIYPEDGRVIGNLDVVSARIFES